MSHPEKIERFQVVRLLGSGGMGHVYEALDTDIDRRVAIKLLRRELLTDNPEILQRLFVEARAANAIDHPGVVQISEARQLSDGTGYLVMEYLDGQTLTQRLSQAGGRLPVPESVDIAIQIAGTLRAGHERGVVHRDLKPDNIMLVRDDAVPGGERVKILDFGIAKLVHTAVTDAPLTLADIGMGTPGYMAPEQLRDAAQASDRCDVYGLGAVLFELLSGRRPHVAPTQVDLMVQVLSQDAPLVSELVDDVPLSLVQLIQSQLIREPAHARPTIADVLLRLYLVRSELSGRPSPPTSGDGLPVHLPPAVRQNPTFDSSGRLAVDTGNQNLQAVPSAVAVDSEQPAASDIRPPSASTISQHAGQQLVQASAQTQTPQWKWAIPLSVAAILLVVGLYVELRGRNSNRSSVPSSIVTTDRSTPSELSAIPEAVHSGVVVPPSGPPLDGPVVSKVTSPASTDLNQGPLEHLQTKLQTGRGGKGARALSSLASTTPPVNRMPRGTKSDDCQKSPVVVSSESNQQVSSAVLEAAKAYNLHLCKGERLVLKRNSRDGVLSPMALPTSLKGRSSFNMQGFLLRIQGRLTSLHDDSVNQITLGSSGRALE